MTTAKFAELIAGRDLTMADDTMFMTPSTDALPNGDAATVPVDPASAQYADTTGLFAIPWGTADWSIECWVRYASSSFAGHTFPILGYNPTGTTTHWSFDQSPAGTPTIRLTLFSSGITMWHNAEYSLTSGAWHHVVFTFNSSLGAAATSGREMKLYRDASLITTSPTPTTAFTIPTPGSGGAIGLSGGSGFTPTMIEMAKFAIYHRLLTGTEITDHYNAMTT